MLQFNTPTRRLLVLQGEFIHGFYDWIAYIYGKAPVTRLFELDCGYYPRASHEDIDLRSKSKATDELADDMQNELSA